MADHWRAGYKGALQTLGHGEAFARPDDPESYRAFDFAEDDLER